MWVQRAQGQGALLRAHVGTASRAGVGVLSCDQAAVTGWRNGTDSFSPLPGASTVGFGESPLPGIQCPRVQAGRENESALVSSAS